VYLFAGERRDTNIGLDYLRARYLSVGAGRFFGRDPIQGVKTAPLTLVPYSYAVANPVNATDPSGRFSLTMAILTAQILDIIAPVYFAPHSFRITQDRRVDCTYSITRREFSCPADHILINPDNAAYIYSGKGDERNNPDYEFDSENGPIPRGLWRISLNRGSNGQSTDYVTASGKHLTKPVFILNWIESPYFNFNRDGFLIHGAGKKKPDESSEGCIIISPSSLRELIIPEDGKVLRVVD
jgi:RHS repeat-associated protein